MKKIVVTGGSGFIGSNLIDYLLKKKYFVINIDKSSYSANPYNVKSFKKKKNYLFFKLDISNKMRIFKILKKFKPIGIINLAAETHVDRSIDNPKAFLAGIKSLIKETKGIFIVEVSYLLDVIRDNLFDTIYHEHLDYHSIISLNRLL